MNTRKWLAIALLAISVANIEAQANTEPGNKTKPDHATSLVFFGSDETGDRNLFNKVVNASHNFDNTIVIIAPASGQKDVDYECAKVIVSNAVAGKHTMIELSTSPNFKSELIRQKPLHDDQVSFLFRNLEPATMYYARIAYHGNKYSAIVSFRTRAAKTAKRFWGVTTSGGVSNSGTLFSFSPDSTSITIHHHYETETRASLNGNLVNAESGKLYGVSVYDGTGFGEVYSYHPATGFSIFEHNGPHQGSVMLGSDNLLYVVDDWINYFQGGIVKYDAATHENFSLDQIIYRFNGNRDGRNPAAQLIESTDGYLYGTAPYGGYKDLGVVYRLKPDGTDFKVLHHFNGINGANPTASIRFDSEGNKYTTASQGGKYGYGVVLKLDAQGKVTVLHHFNKSDGATPKGNVLIKDHIMYGMTSEGGAFDKGAIFSLSTEGVNFQMLYNFNGSNGEHPYGGLSLHDGALYGMTSSGGSHGVGVLFSLATDGTDFQRLINFSETFGIAPNGDLLLMDDFHAPEVPVITSQNIAVFPNPFLQDFITEVKSQYNRKIMVTIMAMNGSVLRTIQAETNAPISLGSDLEKGMYLVKIKNGREEFIQRILKK